MKYFIHTAMLIMSITTIWSCEVYDNRTVSSKHKAIAHFIYHYNNGEVETLDDVKSIRLFIYDKAGSLYRDTLLSREQIIADTGAMQTYLSNGDYTFVSWANTGHNTNVLSGNITDAALHISDAGADCLMFGRTATPVVKGDSLIFDINLFKSVFKVNVLINGLEYAKYPENHYFGIMNHSTLSFNNIPCGEITQTCPPLYNDGRTIRGSFYTPYLLKNDDFILGVYCNNPNSQYITLCETRIKKFAQYADDAVGHDVEIGVNINIDHSAITITITDWDGIIIQEEHLGA